MPAKKKNTRKRARDDADQPTKAPPNKRAKKAAPNTDESQYVRRSNRARRAPAEYWKTNQSSESDNEHDIDNESESESDETSNAHDSDNDSVQTDNTFEPQIRSKRTGSQRNKANQQRQTKSSQQPKRSKSNNARNKRQKNKKPSDSQHQHASQNNGAEPEQIANGEDGSVSAAEIGSNTEKEELEVNGVVHSNRNHNVNAPRRQTDTDLLSPHRRQIIDDLPPRMSNISLLNRSRNRGDNEAEQQDQDAAECVLDLKAIEKVIKESGVIRKSLIEVKKKHDEHYKDLSKSEEQTRTELNQSIEVFNAKYNELKKAFEASKKSIFKDIEKLRVSEDSNEQQHAANTNESEYKLLYEKSTKKIQLLNDEMIALQHELRQKNEENKDLRQKARADLMEYEENKRKELAALNGKYKLEINELEFKLKCVEDEYAEYKDSAESKSKIHHNNHQLMMDNLKRENAALYAELSQFHQTEKTATPNSVILTPINPSNTNNDYRARIRESPLTEKVQNELISISKAKELENEIVNLKQEIVGFEKQLSAKKSLIKEFEELLKKDQVALKKQEDERDALLAKLVNLKKIINMYSILTSTKIQEKIQVIEAEHEQQENVHAEHKQQDIDDAERAHRGKREKYLCRTVNKESKRMLEYCLTLGVNDEHDNDDNNNNDGGDEREEQEKQIHCLYELVSVHNLNDGAAENKKSCLFEDDMVFYTKHAPLWMKGLLQEMFVNT